MRNIKLTNLRIGNYVDGNYAPMGKAADPADTGDEPSTANLSATLDELTAEIVASSTPHHINPMRARRWLLTTEQGQALLLQRATKKKETKMPQVDLMKAIGTMEEVLNAQVTPRDGESFAKAFSRKYETDEGYRRQWQNHQDTKMMLSPNVSKSMPTLTPASTDNPVEAVRQLQQLAAKNGRSFEAEFADPANRALAQKTYSSVPYHAGSAG
jgi:hypothetical protein